MKMPSLSSCMNSSPPAVTRMNYQLSKSIINLNKLNLHEGGVGAVYLTAQILQDKIQLSTRLKGIDEVHYEGMLHLLQNVSLSFGVCRVLGITHNHGLVTFEGK